jgi:hypothetical protein
MTNEQKQQVRDALVRFVNKFDTQARAAENLEGISTSTISQVRNNHWELLSDRLWYHIARQVGFFTGEWQAADTSSYLLLRILFSDAQHYGMTYGIAIGKGLGKTFTAARYAQENSNTYYMEGNEQMNRKSFMTLLMKEANMSYKGGVPEMMQYFADNIEQKEEPLLIIDDAHKLKDRVLHLLVLLSNSLAGKAGIVMMGDDTLRTRIIDGVRLKKVGYDEIYKSIGRRFITLNSPGPKDVELVCNANGLYHEDVVAAVKEECNNDLHAATTLIQMHNHVRMAA